MNAKLTEQLRKLAKQVVYLFFLSARLKSFLSYLLCIIL